DRVLIAQPVRTLHGVVHVPAPVVFAHIAKRRGDAALRRDSMAPRRKHFGDAGRLQAARGTFERGAKTRAAGADDNDIEVVIGNRIGSHQTGPATRRRAKSEVAPTASANARISSIRNIFAPSLCT